MNKIEEELFGQEILWNCKDGRTLKLEHMDSDHLVNTAVMLFNHLVLAFEPNNKDLLIEFNESRLEDVMLAIAGHDPVYVTKHVAVFVCEIQERGLSYLSEYAKRRFLKLQEKLTGVKMFKEVMEVNFGE